jgi:hypothetical protein
MKNYRWSKFQWQDWISDAALRSCSLAARGLWMDLLCLCHEGEPHGHLTISGQAPSIGQIARLVGANYNLVAKLLDELDRHQVFSRTAEGVIFSRRQVRDEARSAAAVAWGKRGGNPALTQGVTGGVTRGLPGGSTSSHPGGVSEQKARRTKANGKGRVNPTHKLDFRDSESESESPSPTPSPEGGEGASPDLIKAVKQAARSAAVPKGAARGKPFRIITGGAAA